MTVAFGGVSFPSTYATRVIEFGELRKAATATSESLGPLHALRFVFDGATLDHTLSALGLAARWS
nr:hypothetical protein [Mycobacterium simulans]